MTSPRDTVPSAPVGRGGSAPSAAILVVFAVPFAGVGLFTGGWALKLLLEWNAMRHWPEVPARVIAARLVESPPDADSGPTWRVEARYAYRVGGREFVGERVSLSRVSDNIDSYQRDRYRDLVAHRDSGEPIPCRVDPRDPSRSVLFPHMRWKLVGVLAVFAILFGGAGFGIAGAAFLGRRRYWTLRRLQHYYPDEPWRWRSDWAAGRVKGRSREAAASATVFAAFWNLVSAPVAFLVTPDVIRANPAAWVAWIFPAVGAVLAGRAALALRRHRKFGASIFEMDATPGVIGGIVAGRVAAPAGAAPARGARITLSCIREERRGSGRDRSRHDALLWQETLEIGRDEMGTGPEGGLSIPVRFVLPYGLESSSADPAAEGRVVWRLEVHAAVSGIDYAADFDVPVFVTAASDRALTEARVAAEHAGRSPAAGADLAASRIGREILADGALRLNFPPARHKAAAASLTAFFCLWMAGAWGIRQAGIPLFFQAAFVLFGVLLLWGVLDLWLRAERIVVDGRRGRVVLAGGLLGLGRPRALRRDAIVSLEPARGMQMGSRLYYRVVIQTDDGRKHVAVSHLEGLAVARRVIAEIRGAMGAPEPLKALPEPIAIQTA